MALNPPTRSLDRMNLARVSQVTLATVFASVTVSSFVPATAQTPPRSIAQVPATTVCPAQLTSRLDQIINRLPRAQWSVLVQNQARQGDRQNLYAHNPSVLLVPASNNKLFTTAAALKKLGAQYQIRTPAFGNSTEPILQSLRVIGQGDPSLSTNQLVLLARQLQQRGVRQVNLLIGDDTVFRGASFNPFWDEEDRGQGYAAPINSLMVNQNNIYYGAAVPNPGNYFVGEFRKVLGNAGIKVVNSTLVRRTPAPAGEVELAAVVSPPLSSLIAESNQESDNIYAEALLKTLGRLQDPNGTDSNTSGVAAVKSILSELGVNPNRYSMVDGSGLADRNRASAEALVQTLQAMALQPEAPIFRRSLAVAGQSGTLKSRFRGSVAQGIVAAKTGTITGAVSLAGYITPPNYSPLVFGVIVNSGSSASTVRSLIDEMVVLLSRLRNC